MIEMEVRRVVADTLGVDGTALAPEVSLVEDLAADSLDLLELIVVFEAELGVALRRRAVEGAQTYGDLVRAVVAALDGQRAGAIARPQLSVRSRLLRNGGATALERTQTFGPYALQVIEEDASGAGSGARLEIELPVAANDDDVATIAARLVRLERRGIALSIRRGGVA